MSTPKAPIERALLPDATSVRVTPLGDGRFRLCILEHYDTLTPGQFRIVRVNTEKVAQPLLGNPKLRRLTFSDKRQTMSLTLIGTRHEVGTALLGEFSLWVGDASPEKVAAELCRRLYGRPPTTG